MPILDEIKDGIEIGYKSVGAYIWVACELCGKPRWVKFRKGKPIHILCLKCARSCRQGSKANHWQGGMIKDNHNGYVLVYSPNHLNITARRYVKRSRLVLEQKLGRPLKPGYVPHHLNGVKDDDRAENLIELSVSEHLGAHRDMKTGQLKSINS